MSSVDNLDAIECPVCLTYMTKLIYICKEGHSICGDCTSRVNNCPQCRSPMTKARNYALESLSKVMDFPCNNDGCKEIIKGDDIEKHNNVCEFNRFRPIKCLDILCGWQGEEEARSHHWKSEHKNSIFISQNTEKPSEFNWVFDATRLVILDAYGESFLLYFNYFSQPEELIANCIAVGTMEDVAKYSLEVKKPKQLVMCVIEPTNFKYGVLQRD